MYSHAEIHFACFGLWLTTLHLLPDAFKYYTGEVKKCTQAKARVIDDIVVCRHAN